MAERDRSPSGRFKYLAVRRVDKAQRAIGSISKLADRKNYDYTEEEVAQIVSALRQYVSEVEDEFARSKRIKGASFRFEEERE
jgi:hypothetical protein